MIFSCPCKAEFCYKCGSRWKTCICPQVDRWGGGHNVLHEEVLYEGNLLYFDGHDVVELEVAAGPDFYRDPLEGPYGEVDHRMRAAFEASRRNRQIADRHGRQANGFVPVDVAYPHLQQRAQADNHPYDGIGPAYHRPADRFAPADVAYPHLRDRAQANNAQERLAAHRAELLAELEMLAPIQRFGNMRDAARANHVRHRHREHENGARVHSIHDHPAFPSDAPVHTVREHPALAGDAPEAHYIHTASQRPMTSPFSDEARENRANRLAQRINDNNPVQLRDLLDEVSLLPRQYRPAWERLNANQQPPEPEERAHDGHSGSQSSGTWSSRTSEEALVDQNAAQNNLVVANDSAVPLDLIPLE